MVVIILLHGEKMIEENRLTQASTTTKDKKETYLSYLKATCNNSLTQTELM